MNEKSNLSWNSNEQPMLANLIKLSISAQIKRRTAKLKRQISGGGGHTKAPPQKIFSSASCNKAKKITLSIQIYTVCCNQMGTVFVEMSSRTALTRHLGMETTF